MATRQTVLITGSRGFLGSWLIQELRKTLPKARLVPSHRGSCDLSDAAAARRLVATVKPALIYHLAGMTRQAGLRDLRRAHVTTTRNLLEASLRLKVRPRVIVAGSSSEYGLAGGRKTVTEDAPAQPVTPYGRSKLAQTRLALSYRRRGLDVVVARIFNVLGPGTPPNLAPGAFARQLARIEKGLQEPRMTVGNLKGRRDYVDARDVARALARLASPALTAPLYNVCSGRAPAMSAVLAGLLRLSRARVEVVSLAPRGGKADLRLMKGSGRRLAAASGFRPRVPLERSLRDMLTWYRRSP